MMEQVIPCLCSNEKDPTEIKSEDSGERKKLKKIIMEQNKLMGPVDSHIQK